MPRRFSNKKGRGFLTISNWARVSSGMIYDTIRKQRLDGASA
jgi:hypothetical protein